MISVCGTVRKRPVKDNPRQRTRAANYFLKIKERRSTEVVKVCKFFFMAAVAVKNHRLFTVCKIIDSRGYPKERRGGDHVSKKSLSKREKVREFISKLRGTESHYNRSKSSRVYLPAYLSITKLRQIYNEQAENQDQVSYSMFRNVFLTKFNIGFSSPASDTCSQCTRLKHLIKSEKDQRKKVNFITEYRIHRKRAKAFYYLCKQEPNNSLTFCFDLQQVQPLPRTPISDAFYSHQISLYSFCCVTMTSNNPTFYIWTENQAGRGSTEIGSALFDYLKSLDLTGITQIRLFCDGCGGQNKNSHIIHMLMFWLLKYSPDNITEVTITYPVRGHSSMPADRVFRRVEKIFRKNPTIVYKDEYIDYYSEVGSVKILGQDWKVFDIKELQNFLNKITGIADLKRISLQKKYIQGSEEISISIACFQNFRSEAQSEVSKSLYKRGKTLKNFSLYEVHLRDNIPQKKIESVKKLMEKQFGKELESDENFEWYRKLLCEIRDENNNQEITQEEDIMECDCLEEESALHI